MPLLNEKNLHSTISNFKRNRYDLIQGTFFEDDALVKSWIIDVLKQYSDGSLFFKSILPKKINSKRTVYTSDLESKIILKTISRRIKIAFKIRDASRNQNITVLKNICVRNNRITVFKLDIEKFFDTINHKILLDIIRKNRYLRSCDISLIEKYLATPSPSGSLGVHQGTELSNVLAEIYFSKIDYSLRSLDSSVIFCDRYVDDIIVVFNKILKKDEIESLYYAMRKKVQEYLLDFKNHKTEIVSIYSQKPFKLKNMKYRTKSTPFSDLIKYSISKKGRIHKHLQNKIKITYLGYTFLWSIDNSTNIMAFDIFISTRKIHKYKTKIYNTFNDFKVHRSANPKRNDFAYYLLRERIRFLSQTYILPDKKIDSSITIIGIQETYKYITDDKDIIYLMNYIAKNIYYLLKNGYITPKQYKNLILLVNQNGKTVSFTNASVQTLKQWIKSSNNKSVSYISKDNHHLRKEITAKYMKTIKIGKY